MKKLRLTANGLKSQDKGAVTVQIQVICARKGYLGRIITAFFQKFSKVLFGIGIYYWCAVYFGRAVNSAVKNGMQQRLAAYTSNPYVFHRLNDEQWLVHGPEMLKTVGSLNGGLERHEIAAGAVNWSQVVPFTENWQKPGAREYAEILNQALVETIGVTESKPKAGFYVIEGVWSTLDSDRMNDISVSYNLPVVNIPSDIAKEFDLEV